MVKVNRPITQSSAVKARPPVASRDTFQHVLSPQRRDDLLEANGVCHRSTPEMLETPAYSFGTTLRHDRSRTVSICF